MNSKEIRQKFFDFFASKNHKIVSSAPIVVKDDPTLMFTNAGMNQFKDFFLGTKEPEVKRIADTQKCLRVSGKHNDLEEVGRDSYHHTMFEMLGNWSFGDYFKEEAITWAWELLTQSYGLDEDRLYASVFAGDKKEGLSPDNEAVKFWKKYIPEERILYFDKKDNFWEMGDTGPCGPCSEVHIDLRSAVDRAKIDGKELVNKDHPQVIEIWNLVFIQYNRKADGSLEELPAKHIDTGMGFERLCMAMQGKTSNYDTDLFTPFIQFLEKETKVNYTGKYREDAKSDIAMRVIVDHLRAVAFTIADGELPSNTGAGYVIRRILRRAVRYYYSFLDIHSPLLYKLVPLLAEHFGEIFPEIEGQKEFIAKVIHEEEKSFLRTLDEGLKRMESIQTKDGVLDGQTAFELYDTYGFPIDLTRLIAEEKGWNVDEKGFRDALSTQKERSRMDAKRETGDWQIISDQTQVTFVGYDQLVVDDAKILRFRTLKQKNKELYQLVLDKTPFYPEGGGQVGDCGFIIIGEERIKVLTTKKESDLIIHYIDKLPKDTNPEVKAVVDADKRHLTENNHTATHLLHAALREVLGTHVQQRGSLVKDDYLRFDFSHFQKMSIEEVSQVEKRVNEKIRENIALQEDRRIPIAEAKAAGAMMLFGEKYGDQVRMITFDPSYSRELCGGCHVDYTGQIGYFKITSESAIAAGVRRIEAITASASERYINKELEQLSTVRGLLKNPKQVVKNVAQIIDENKALKKEIEKLQVLKAQMAKTDIKQSAKQINGITIIAQKISDMDTKTAKTLAYNLEQELGESIILLALDMGQKAQLQLMVSKSLTDRYHAGNMVREIAKSINGGGGGQPFFASAGGSNPDGLDNAISQLLEMVRKL